MSYANNMSYISYMSYENKMRYVNNMNMSIFMNHLKSNNFFFTIYKDELEAPKI